MVDVFTRIPEAVNPALQNECCLIARHVVGAEFCRCQLAHERDQQTDRADGQCCGLFFGQILVVKRKNTHGVSGLEFALDPGGERNVAPFDLNLIRASGWQSCRRSAAICG